MQDGGLALALGVTGRCDAGTLSVGWDDDADVPMARGDDFPFEDGVVDTLRAGPFLADLALAPLVHVLLECRRVLRAGGMLRVEAPDDEAATARLHEHAKLVGLEPLTGPRNGRGTVRAARPDGIVLTKRDRRAVGLPLVSIAIPAYNPRYFAAALDSALAQTYPNVEIVVCDDSRDEAIEAIVAARTPRTPIRYLHNRVRLRPRANFTRCFEESRGEFIKLLCDDDLLAPACVERLVDAFRAAPDITLATSHRARIDAGGQALAPLPATWPIVDEDAVIAGPTLANAMLMAGLNTVGEPSTVLFRRDDLAAHAPHYFEFRGSPGHGIIDLVTWTRLLMKGNAVYLRDTLSGFRFHGEQRQHDPAMRERSVASIRELQAAWLELEIHQRQSPDVLLVKRFPADGDDWQAQRVQGLSVRRA